MATDIRRQKRILKEINELQKSKDILDQSGIYIHIDENNINTIYAMLMGPSETPYEKGFYFLTLTYPESYPMQPPIAKYCTQGLLINPQTNAQFNVRFNPNLYTCGKVCLSMLNTWAGPGWVPTNTMTNVVVAIQALVLNDLPLRNEPGFENAPIKELRKYNEILNIANIKIAVIEMITNTPEKFIPFKEKMVELFMKNIDYYRNFILEKNDELKDSIIESPAYGMKACADYGTLLYELTNLEESFLPKS